uniref:Notch N4 n=1 Tax=Nilaparvata lugens TaxID=108931 RepID=A0A2Z2R3I4_NILLU|nr:notch N4 [Nilaparvata lugens]
MRRRVDYFLFPVLILLGFCLLDLPTAVTGVVSCSPNPCKNGGACLTSPKGKSFCNCTSQYVGEYCQRLNPCTTGPVPRCQNGGTCNVRMSPDHGSPSFWCACPIGYSASLCEIHIANSCDSQPCHNGGTCTLQSLSKYTCTCAAGFTGPQCEKQDQCASSPCRNGATCLSLDEGGFRCECAPGFTGATCSQDVDECFAAAAPCQNGQCVNTHGSYTCVCEAGYTGHDCASKYYPYDPSPCQHAGTCTQVDKLTYQCTCPTGESQSFSHSFNIHSFIHKSWLFQT